MAHDASQNKPMKELSYALVGLGAFLAIVLLIGVSAYLRPAGVHIAPEPEEVAADAVVVAESDVVPAVVTQDAASTEVAIADVEPSQSSAEAVAANTDADEAQASISNESSINENLRSDAVVVAEDMSIGGEGAVTE